MTAAGATETAPRAKRADAVRNRERVIEAAAAVFAESGLDAGVPEVAARAGVGKATVYRSFPTKDHLMAAVAIERLRWFVQVAGEAEEKDDAWAAFRELLAAAAEAQCTDRAMADAISLEPQLAELEAARQDALAALGRVMKRAQKQGKMRRDVTAADVRILFGGAARLLTADGNHDPDLWRHFAGLVADAFRVQPS